MVSRATEVKRYGSDVIVDIIKALEIEYVTLNPGASFRGIHDSIVNYGKNKDPEVILCCHEEIAVAIAMGYTRAKGKPMLAILHDMEGLAHGTKAIYDAYLMREPILIFGGTGPMDITKRRPWIDWIHTSLVVGNMVRDIVKWDDQPQGLESTVEAILRGYQVAMTEPRGPIYIAFDAEFQESQVNPKYRIPNISKFISTSHLNGDPDALKKAAEILRGANKPVIIAEHVGRNPSTVKVLQEFAELIGAPTLDMGTRFNMPTNHPLNALGYEDEALQEADVVLALDVKDLYFALVKQRTHYERTVNKRVRADSKIINIGLFNLWIRSWSYEYGRLQPTDLSITADTALALPYLQDICEKIIHANPPLRKKAKDRIAICKERQQRVRKELSAEVKRRWNEKPISSARLVSEVWRAVKDEDWILAYTTPYITGMGGWIRRIFNLTSPTQYPGKGSGTGVGIGFALGVALAHRGSSKLLIDFQPDGDLLYSTSALWTASHYRLPLLVIMANNRSYYNDEAHQEAMAKIRSRPIRNKVIGIRLDTPPTNFAKIAQAFGLHGEGPIEDPDEVAQALKRAINVVKQERKLALVDTVTQNR